MAKKTQTTIMNGKRVRLVTAVSKTGTKVTVKEAQPKEWELQAAQVQRLKVMPEYARTARDAGPGKFTLAGDQNASKRGPRAQLEALASGLTSGEHDVRIYMAGGQLGLIENKVGKGPLSQAQTDRHALLFALGFKLQEVVRAVSKEEAADKAEAIVRGWIAANDNKKAAQAV